MTHFLQASRAIIFDFDGTIFDSNDIKKSCFADVFNDQCFVDQDLLNFISSLGNVDRFAVISACAEYFFGGVYTELDVQDKVTAYSKCCHQRILSANEIPGALNFIKLAHKYKYSLFISSATPQRELIEIVESLKIMNYFEGVFGGPESKVSHINFISDDYPNQAKAFGVNIYAE